MLLVSSAICNMVESRSRNVEKMLKILMSPGWCRHSGLLVVVRRPCQLKHMLPHVVRSTLLRFLGQGCPKGRKQSLPTFSVVTLFWDFRDRYNCNTSVRIIGHVPERFHPFPSPNTKKQCISTPDHLVSPEVPRAD